MEITDAPIPTPQTPLVWPFPKSCQSYMSFVFYITPFAFQPYYHYLLKGCWHHCFDSMTILPSDSF